MVDKPSAKVITSTGVKWFIQPYEWEKWDHITLEINDMKTTQIYGIEVNSALVSLYAESYQHTSDPLGRMIWMLAQMDDQSWHDQADNILLLALKYLAPMCPNTRETIQSIDTLTLLYQKIPK